MQFFIKTVFLTAFCAAIACTQNNSGKSSGQPNSGAANTSSAARFANETDFICDMKVKPEFEDTCHYKGKVYAFCSESCKETFQGNPEKYLAGQ